ncbi:Putative major facilitator, sugar transporter, major facilitator superfamily [Colletotrichum destructivum]|uniref:Major facilitator, sugar transporter, major facilitator superfamily n=1 Tax=Colletotrichum destructivum TaxID=34406 RepID=A0AAX4I7L8_9PEZI|nr:Putative major facilitator, sugar transporter, major facilitator superfamily [Colletotrichum destructivum]
MFGKPKAASGKSQSISPELAAVLPNNDTPWYKQKHLIWLNFYCIFLAFLCAANGYDGSMMNGLLALPQWHSFMDHPTGSWLGFINAAHSLSTMLAYPAVAYFANRWGRKKGLFVGYFFLTLGSLLQAFSPNHIGFILGRVFIGQPSAWWGGLAPLLITELAYPTHRGILTALYNTGWFVGSSLAAWITFGTRNYGTSWAWRIPSLLQIGIPLAVLPAALFVPESPRFLVSKGQVAKARSILTKFHGGGDENSTLVEFEMTEIERAIEDDKSAAASSSWMEMFNTPGNRRRAFISVTLGLLAQWCGVNVVSYYLAMVLETVGITSVTDQTLISGCLQIWNLIWAVSAAVSVDRLGRRPLFLISSGGMLASFIVISGLSGSFDTTKTASVGIAVVPFLYIYNAFYDIAFTPLIVSYPAEIWPYQLRARGTALTQMATYFGIFFNVFVNPIALEAIGWKYYLVFVAILVVGCFIVYFFYPETRGHTLEEMAVIFDGESARVTDSAFDGDVKSGAISHHESA